MPKILLIDDDVELGAPLGLYFARFGLVLTCALAPSAGLALLRQGGFDAAILDVMLPEMDGVGLCRAIRKKSHILLAMLTARLRGTGGVGLGLYLCRLVAQAHGGRLKLVPAHPGLDAMVDLPKR